ncbi:MAG: protein kinase [Polyangiaceae bacterium]
MSPSPEPDRVLLGRYRLQERVDEGGMGQIWRAEHLVLGAPVAVKIVDRDLSRDEEALARFNREAQAAAQLRSPHVVQILDYGIDGGLPFIVMELLEGETLARRLKREKRLSPETTSRVVSHMARAISRAHEAGIVHRDLKPENVFLVHNEDEEIAKVLDFGVAKVESSTLGPKGERTRTGSLLGTPFYMSPEQAQGNKTVDFRTDLWALGVIAFECITGKRPFESEGLGDLVLSICVRPIPVPSEFGPVPSGFDEWFAKATEREPADRFQSARELAESLRDLFADSTGEVQVTVPEGEDEWGAAPAQPAAVSANARTIQAPVRFSEASADTIAQVPQDIPVTGDTMASVVPVRRSPRPWVVVSVALAALAAGGATGIALMKSETTDAAPIEDTVSRPALDTRPIVKAGARGRPATKAVATDSSGAPAASDSANAMAKEEEEPASKSVRDAAADGLSPAAQRAAAIMKGLVEPDGGSGAPAPSGAP